MSGDLRFGCAGRGQAGGLGDLVVGELAGPAAVSAVGSTDGDTFTLAFPDQGALELGHGTEQVQLEGGERVVPAGVEDEAFDCELHPHPASGQLGDEWARSTTERARRSIDATGTVSP